VPRRQEFFQKIFRVFAADRFGKNELPSC
jgi:hypothetical protein